MSLVDRNSRRDGPSPARLFATWPLVGRDRELELLTDAISSAPAGEGPMGAVVVAPAGTGKTRLAREASRRAGAAGVTTHWAVGTAAASLIPYGALAHLAPRVSPSNYTDAVSFHAAFIAALAPEGDVPPLLVVDDAQHLDAGSASLVLRMALTRAAVVLATVRSGEPVPDPIAALWRDGLTHRLDISPLNRRDAASLVRTALGGMISEPALRRLYDVTGGSPLHIREFVLAAVEAGSLTRHDGVWNWDGGVPLPNRLVDAVGGRLGALSEHEQRALAVLALGEPLEPRLAEYACDRQALVSLERAGMVERVRAPQEGHPDSYRLGHPLLGEVALAALTSSHRRELLHTLADVASRQLLDGAGRMRLACWQLDAGDQPDLETLLSAARHANSVFAFEEGIRLAEAAVGQGDDVSATVLLAAALNGLGRFREAADRLAAVEAVAFAEERADVRIQYLDCRFVALYHGLGADADAEAMLDRFHEHCRDPHSRRHDATLRAVMLLEAGHPREAAELALEVLQDPDAQEHTFLVAGEAAGEALILMGESKQARAVHAQLRSFAAQGGPFAPRARRTSDLQEILCQLQEGRLELAESLIRANYTQWVPGYDDVTLGLAAFGLGNMQLLRGRPASALKELREAAACLHRAGLDGTFAWVLAATASAEARLGDGDGARETLARARRMPIAEQRSRGRLDFVLADVFIRAALGDSTGAARLALDHADRFRELPVHRARLLHTAMRLGAPATTVAPLLAECAAACSSPLPALLATHADRAAAEDAVGLDEVSQRFEKFGLRLEAAETAVAAAMLLHAGPAADRARARAARLAAECEGVAMTQVSQVEQLPVLTRREREVARLAAAGLSSPAIAERLVVSVRTVESHLYQVFAKLGVRRREEIAALIGTPEEG
ncbi:LuxR family transcriptional regulator [Tessaracoccus terricola]